MERSHNVAVASARAQAEAAARAAEQTAGIDSSSTEELKHRATVLKESSVEFKSTTKNTSDSALPLLNRMQENLGEKVGLGLYIFFSIISVGLLTLGDAIVLGVIQLILLGAG